MKYNFVFIAVFLLMCGAACTPMVIGGGAAGGYKVATDDRTAGQIVDDITITAVIKKRLIQDSDVVARRINVDTVGGQVFLSGMVASVKEAERAVEIAATVSGVKTVTSDLQVGRRTIGEILDDKVISGRVKSRLIGEPGVRALNVDVDVYQGVVFLTGTVANQEQKNKVSEITETTVGVKRVVNNLIVKN